MGAIARATENYTKPTAVVAVWLDSEVTPKRAAAITKLRQAENVVAALEREKPAEDGSSKPLGNPQLKQARQQVTRYRRELDELEERERAHAHLLQFAKLDGIQWADISAVYTPRPGNRIDDQTSTNYHAAGLHAAKVSGSLLVEDPEGSVEVDGTTYRPEPIDDEDWQAIQEIGSGWDIERIAWANLELNVLHSSNQLARLSKG